MTKDTESYVNIYTDGTTWYYAAWIDGEYDSNGVLYDAETQIDAEEIASDTFGTDDIRLVDYQE